MKGLIRSSHKTHPLSRIVLHLAILCAILLFSFMAPWHWKRESGRAQAPHLTTGTVPGDEHWTPSFILNGLESPYIIATDGTNIYTGGSFDIAGGVVANNIAMWNALTNRWVALGSGMNYTVWALATDRSGNLYAGGDFTLAGSVAANHIARWDGSIWSELGSGVDGEVRALAVDNNGNVYAGGSFSTAGGVPANNIAKWDTAAKSWSALGSGVSGGNTGWVVASLVVDRNGSVYAGGSFTIAGGKSAKYVARWNGRTWKSLGAGISGGSSDGTMVTALALDDKGYLYAGGDFTLAGTVSANNIARWDGSNWYALGSGLVDGFYRTSPRALAMYGGNLYAAGDFTMAGGVLANHVAKWNGINWEALSSGTNDFTDGLAIDHSGNVYVSGDFRAAGGTGANHIARWDGQNWSVVGFDNSLNSAVLSIVVDKNNQVYAGGVFTTAGGKPANRIARWNGSDWSALGEGIPGTYCDGYFGSCVLALSMDSSSNLYAGGTFTMTAGINTNHIARWDGSSWSALGSGVNGGVNALAVDDNGNIYAGGIFSMAGAAPANNIAKWNVSTNQWEALGAGLEGGFGMSAGVSALVVDRNGNLYAGGTFTQTGELTVNHVAKWNGSVWSALGAGVCCGSINKGGFDLTEVSALAVDHNGNLYVGGDFRQAGDINAMNVAMWNGSNWQALGSGITDGRSGYGPRVNAIAVDPNDHLIVGGYISQAGDVIVRGIAVWDGISWSTFGSGISGYYFVGCCVSAIATDSNGNIYVGGGFDMAGGKPSVNFARWSAQIYPFYFPLVAQ